MIKNRLFRGLVIASTIIICIDAATIVRKKGESQPIGFTENILQRALDPATGTFFVSLSGTGDSFNVSRSPRYASFAPPQFTGIAPDDINSASIDYMTLSPLSDNAARIAGASSDTNINQLFFMKNDGSSFSFSGALNDAGTDMMNAFRVVGVTASSTHLIAAVTPHRSGGILPSDTPLPFGNITDAPNTLSGLALIAINTDNSLTIKNATTGLSGNQAQRLDITSDVFTAGISNVFFLNNGTQSDIDDPDDDSKNVIPQLIYDAPLNLFYVGTDMQPNTSNGDKAISIAITYPDPTDNNALTLQSIIPSTITAPGDTDKIIFAENDADATLNNLYVKKIGVLHASTGPSYLIVAGGSTADTSSQTGNTVYALPIVDNPDNPDTHGTIADKTSSLTNGVFTVRADAAGELPLTTDRAAQIGAGPLPFESTNCVSDMVALCDTVYVSVDEGPDDNNEPGIFYSHALFDTEGKIINWTPWTKKALPHNAFPNQTLPNDSPHMGQVALFQVDPTNGKIWFVEGTTPQRVVGITSWDSPKNISNDTPLVEQLNTTFSNGCYCALDLDQSTRGLCDQVNARYALFGGSTSIAFVRTSTAQSPTMQSIQMVPEDFSLPENFLLTRLPNNSGCCQTLEYSRRIQEDATNEKYFFAGTDKGLFVFARDTGDGLDSSDIAQLPFGGNPIWHAVTTITGSITAIKTSGTTLYVLAQATDMLQSTVYRINIDTPISLMFDSSNISIIARTGSNTFTATQLFYDISIVAIDDDTNEEQLVLATNTGLYESTKDGGVQDAMDDTGGADGAAWSLIASGFFTGISEPDNTPKRSGNDCPGIPASTIWPFQLTDPSSNGLFNASKLYQLTGRETNMLAFTPNCFNTRSLAPAFSNLDPIITFNSDGARRFFVINRQIDPFTSRNLEILPFDSAKWNVTTQAQTIISDPQLQNINAIFWIKPIGAIGSILMGTDRGIFALD